jgi:hypothetical protein
MRRGTSGEGAAGKILGQARVVGDVASLRPSSSHAWSPTDVRRGRYRYRVLLADFQDLPQIEVRYSEFGLATQSPVFKVPAQIERAFVDRVRVRISWADLALDQLSAALDDGAEEPRRYDEDHRVRVPASVVLRRGSARFRRTLLEAYDGRCAVTGTWIHGLLEAAHITPQRAGA